MEKMIRIPTLDTVPEVGMRIYIPTEVFTDLHYDRIEGGIATITEVETLKLSQTQPALFYVHVAERPDTIWEWGRLVEMQAELMRRFGNKVASGQLS